MKDFYCKQCGRKLDRKFKHSLCQKHWNELCEYGYCITDTQMYDDIPNEIIKCENVAKIVLYDSLFEETDEEILIDIEDINTVNKFHWSKKNECVTGMQLGNVVLLPNLILDTDNKIEYINGNFLDNRKENLREIKKEKKKNNKIFNTSKKNKNKIIVEFVGESHNGVVGSSVACSYPTKEGEYETILIELGMVQRNGALREEYVVNKEVVDRVLSYGNFKAVFVSHSHL